MQDPVRLARFLAESLTAGPWEADALRQRGEDLLARPAKWLPPLIDRLLAAFPAGGRPPTERVAAFLERDRGLERARARRRGVALAGRTLAPPVMAPAVGPPQGWAVPAIATPAVLAQTLGLDVGELDWFADRQGRATRGGAGSGPLGHYRYRWQPKRSGTPRLVEAPKPRLKAIQRAVVRTILDRIPPHDAAHGFRKGRSIRTHAAPHVNRPFLLALDLADFFPTITAARVRAVFHTAGYPEDVADQLAGLCTNRVPRAVWDEPACPLRGPDHWRIRRVYAAPHLPQGAPSSPALANLVAYRLDARLTGLAAAVGARYSRYADDLVFSGGDDLARGYRRVVVQVGAIARDEGFALQHRKTRVLRQGVRQRVTGVVVNRHPNVPRDAYDALKATLHNCVHHGPASQNHADHPDFRAHLAGRIAHVEMLNPARATRLQALFQRIAW
jgi:hypothetical protein